MRRVYELPIVCGLIAVTPEAALAGMPSVQLSDLARMRVQTISFFLVGLLGSAGLIQVIWNRLGRDFSMLPALSYGKAVGLVSLWGLLFVLVLTMISGARELLTPGAWKKDGATYRLAEQPPAAAPTPAVDEYRERERRQKLDELRIALWRYADSNDGHFPADRKDSSIAGDKWLLPDLEGIHYFYVSGLSAGQGRTPLAYEPGIYGSRRYVLFANGDIAMLETDEIVNAFQKTEVRR